MIFIASKIFFIFCLGFGSQFPLGNFENKEKIVVNLDKFFVHCVKITLYKWAKKVARV